MKSMIKSTINPMVVGEVLTSASNMVAEIAHYKRAIAELEVQRLHMYEQAKIVRAQIKVHHQQEIKRMDAVSSAFKTCLKQNKQVIVLQKQLQDHAQEQCMMILNMIHQENVPEQKTELMKLWQEMLKQINANREETARLQQSLMDAFHQFGIDLSRPGLELKDVF